MNFLNIRKGPEMDFIVGEHRNDYEKHVLDLYMETTEGFWGKIPSLERSILVNINPKFLFAAILGESTGDPSFYAKQTTGKIIPEYEQYWRIQNLNEIARENPERIEYAHLRAFFDTKSILDYHNMFYALKVGEDEVGGNGIQVFKNIPILEVW